LRKGRTGGPSASNKRERESTKPVPLSKERTKEGKKPDIARNCPEKLIDKNSTPQQKTLRKKIPKREESQETEREKNISKERI